LKYGSLNLLETSEHVQACTGISVPFTDSLTSGEKPIHL